MQNTWRLTSTFNVEFSEVNEKRALIDFAPQNGAGDVALTVVFIVS